MRWSPAQIGKAGRQTLWRTTVSVQSRRRPSAKPTLLQRLQRYSISRSPHLVVEQRSDRVVEQLVKATSLGCEPLQIVRQGFVKGIVEMAETFASRRWCSSKTRNHSVWDESTVLCPGLIQGLHTVWRLLLKREEVGNTAIKIV